MTWPILGGRENRASKSTSCAWCCSVCCRANEWYIVIFSSLILSESFYLPFLSTFSSASSRRRFISSVIGLSTWSRSKCQNAALGIQVLSFSPSLFLFLSFGPNSHKYLFLLYSNVFRPSSSRLRIRRKDKSTRRGRMKSRKRKKKDPISFFYLLQLAFNGFLSMVSDFLRIGLTFVPFFLSS